MEKNKYNLNSEVYKIGFNEFNLYKPKVCGPFKVTGMQINYSKVGKPIEYKLCNQSDNTEICSLEHQLYKSKEEANTKIYNTILHNM